MENKLSKTNTVHHILSRSYSVYLFCVIGGLILDTVYPVHFGGAFHSNLGFLFMCIGTLFIYWAQSSSSAAKKKALKTNSHVNFKRGPYKYSRNPTHIGLLFVTFGFGFMIGSFFVIVFSLFSFVVTKLVFLPKEEKLLEKKYGEVYARYKKEVHTWI